MALEYGRGSLAAAHRTGVLVACPAVPHSNWYKGNIHTHTTESDGDSSPEHVAEWYNAHEYDFLALTDHDHLTVIEDAASNRDKWPLLIPGEEVTSRLFENTSPVHVNGIGISHHVEAAYEEGIVETLQENIDRIRAAGGLASIDHPNYKWAFGDREITQVTGAWAMEVHNAHPGANSLGGGGRPGTEAMWDRVLSAGTRLFGIASDDSHHYTGEFSADRSNPGRGWVVVRATDLDEDSLMTAMSEGDFYASTGVVIGELSISTSEVVIELAPRTDERLTTIFYGRNGRELWRSDDLTARYRPLRLDGYVRATVESSRGSRAWTQPVFVDG